MCDGCHTPRPLGENWLSPMPDWFSAGAASVRTPTDLPSVLQSILQPAQAAGFTSKELFGIRLAVEEAIVNAIKHAHKNDPTKQVRVYYHLSMREIEIVIEDEGPGFRPDEIADPTEQLNLEHTGGRGLLLMRHYMCDVRHNRSGNCVALRKRRA